MSQMPSPHPNPEDAGRPDAAHRRRREHLHLRLLDRHAPPLQVLQHGPHAEALLEYYFTSQLIQVTLTGEQSPITSPKL